MFTFHNFFIFSPSSPGITSGIACGSLSNSFFLSFPRNDVHSYSFVSLDFHICEFMLIIVQNSCLTLNVIPHPLIFSSNVSLWIVTSFDMWISKAKAAFTKFLIRMSLILSSKCSSSITTCVCKGNLMWLIYHRLRNSNQYWVVEDVLLLDSSFLHIDEVSLVFLF